MTPARGLVLLLGLVLVACTPEQRSEDVPRWLDGSRWDIDTVAALPLNDDPYLGALQTGYTDLARAELAEFDWRDGGVFTSKARLAAQGGPVPPTDFRERAIPEATAEGLEKGFALITGYIASEGAMLRAARQIGEAQIQYDCWVQEAQEGHQFEQISTCRETFELMVQLIRDLADLPRNMAVVLPEEGGVGGIEIRQGEQTVTLDRAFAAAGTGAKFGDLPVAEGEIREAFAGALAAQPPPPVEFGLTFAFNSAVIGDQAFEAILAAAEEARGRDAAEVLVTGYADRPGDASGNLAVSRARAEAVREAIFNELRDKEDVRFSTAAKGARDPVIDTGRAEEQNRRVVILVR